jgi:transcriptional regulator with PAS, ATPase and Fis domain
MKPPPLIGISRNIQRIKELITHIAPTGLNVVITGESGVGKEVVAWNLYEASPRKGKSFVKINCAALPEGLLESELFGYERGAFTGADQKKRGKFELAHEGILLLDEIGDMSISLQSKLLHVLQSGEFAPLGSEKDMKTDVWIIASTNRNLEQEIREGNFREDLFYRLNIINIYIEPLRKRPEDIPPLIEYYLKIYSSQFAGNSPHIPTEAQTKRLLDYSWPGNVRELQNVLKKATVLGNWDETIDELMKSGSVLAGRGDEGKGVSISRGHLSDNFDKKELLIKALLDIDSAEALEALATLPLKTVKRRAVDRIEKEVIRYVLDKTEWNRTRASKILKISYKTLLTKMSELEIGPDLPKE